MKYAEMSERQQRVFRGVLGAANDVVGGLENTLLDNAEDSEEYRNAKEALADHDGLAFVIYGMVINGNTGTEFVSIRDVRFCGREWIKERIEKRLIKMGY